MTFTILILLILFLSFIGWYYYTRTKVHFPSQHAVVSTIKSSPYLPSFSQFDYKIRGSLNKTHLLSKYKLYLEEPTPKQKDIITFFCKKADDMLYKYPEYAKIANLDWNIILFTVLENGMPHTHGKYILLPKRIIPSSRTIETSQRRRFIETLIHEKIHVYQRTYPTEAIKDAAKLGFYPPPPQKDIYLPPELETFRRKNPDFEGLYLWKKRYISLYLLNLDSKGLADGELVLYDTKRYISFRSGKVFNNYIDFMKRNVGLGGTSSLKPHEIEHPNEIVAYSISKQVIRGGDGNGFFKSP